MDPRLAQIVDMPSAPAPMAAGLAMPTSGAPGGMPQGAPQGVGLAGGGGDLDPAMVDSQINQFLGSQPQAVAQIQQVMQEAMASGELTPEELSLMGQLATMAMQNPEMYPQIVQYAVQQGIAQPGDLPEQYDAGMAIAIVIAVRALQQGQQNMPSMAAGGPVPDSTSGSTVIEAHNGEYMIPENVVRAKGTEFFDKLVAQYAKPPAATY